MKIKWLLAFACSVVISGNCVADTTTQKSKSLIDYFLPMPVRGELSKDAWGQPPWVHAIRRMDSKM